MRRPAKVWVLLLALLALAGCGTRGKPVPRCTGEVRQLNPGRWQPGPNELAAPRRSWRSAELCPPASTMALLAASDEKVGS